MIYKHDGGRYILKSITNNYLRSVDTEEKFHISIVTLSGRINIQLFKNLEFLQKLRCLHSFLYCI